MLYVLMSIIATLCFVGTKGLQAQEEQISFAIVTCSYNNSMWCERNLVSIFEQQYSNWHLFYIDDCSTDDTVIKVKELINRYHMQNKVTLICNKRRHGHMHNQYYVIQDIAPNHVVTIVDGDDWLAHQHVLQKLNEVYSYADVWLTYGQFWYLYKDRLGICRQLPADIITQNRIRDYPIWVTSHLRTFYAGLFQRIQLEDLLYEGSFVPMSVDVATMFPMIEMAGEHIRFIDEVLYIYNDANQLNFYHTQKEQQGRIKKELLKRPRYKPLSRLFS